MYFSSNSFFFVFDFARMLVNCMDDLISQGWGVAVLVGVPHKDAVFKTHPMNLLHQRTLKGTLFGNYKPRTDLPAVVEKYMNKVMIEISEIILTLCYLSPCSDN